MSCRSDGGLLAPLPAGMCTGWTRRRGLTRESFPCGGGWTNVGMGVGGLQYRMFLEGFSGGFEVAGELFLLFLFLGGGEANISGSAGFSSASVGLSLSGEVGVSNIHLDSVSKQMPASKYVSYHHSLGATRATLNTQMPPLRRPAAESNNFNPQTERKWRHTGCNSPSRPSK